MRSRGSLVVALASVVGVLASGGAAISACTASSDTLPPIPPPHYGNGDGGAQDGAAADDSGIVTPQNDGAASEACVETTSASPDGGVTVGPTSLAFDPCGNGSPDALYWDATKHVLYIADDQNAAIWTWSDATGFQKLARVPVEDGGATAIGGIAGYGNLLVISRNGGGASGALFQYDVSTTSGVATTIGGPVNPARHRTAVAYDATGTRFFSASWASASDADAGADASAAPSGSIDLIGVTTTTPFVTGLGQPHGLLVSGAQFVVGDDALGAIVSFPLAAGDILDAGLDAADDGGDAAVNPLYTTVAAIPGVDQLSAGPGGSILAAQHTADGGAPQIHEIASDGGVAPFQAAATFTKLGGIAYDATYNRVFVADSNGTSVRTIKIYPAQ